MFFSNFFAGAFGLNIGDLSLKLVQLSHNGRLADHSAFTVRAIRTIPLSPGLIVNGEVEQPELVRKKLLQLLGREGNLFPPLKTKWAVVDLPEPRTFLKLITIEAPPETLTDTDIVFQASKHLPVELEKNYLDWKIINGIAGKNVSHVLIGAVPKVIADSYTYLLESADINVIALEIEAVAISRALITRSKSYSGEARALLDLGATRSSLIIYDHDTIQFNTTIPFSGELLTTAVVQALKIDYAAAEKLKIKNGLSYDKAHPRYLRAVSAVAEILLTHIGTALQFYKEHFPETNPVTHITMCGGLAALSNLDTLMARRLKISAKPGQAWKNISAKLTSDTDRQRGLSLTSAIGLAMRATENPVAHII